jgi:hypothetical protein
MKPFQATNKMKTMNKKNIKTKTPTHIINRQSQSLIIVFIVPP